MPGVDESKQFVPLKIAVLTVSDTRSLKDDKSGALLVQRIVSAGHFVAERSLVHDDIDARQWAHLLLYYISRSSAPARRRDGVPRAGASGYLHA